MIAAVLERSSALEKQLQSKPPLLCWVSLEPHGLLVLMLGGFVPSPAWGPGTASPVQVPLLGQTRRCRGAALPRHGRHWARAFF